VHLPHSGVACCTCRLKTGTPAAFRRDLPPQTPDLLRSGVTCRQKIGAPAAGPAAFRCDLPPNNRRTCCCQALNLPHSGVTCCKI